MKVRTPIEPTSSANLSQNKTLKTASTIADVHSVIHETPSTEKYIMVHDEEIIPLMFEKKYTQASFLLHQLIEQLQSDSSIKDEMVKAFRLYVCFYNLGVVSWKLKRFKDAEKYLDEAIYFLQMNINSCQYKEEHLVFTIELVKLQLQQSVVLSQNGKHWKAADIGDQVVKRLFECFNVKMKMVRDMLFEIKRDKKNKENNWVDFKKVVLNQAKQKLKFMCDFEKSYKFTEQSKEKLHQVVDKLYMWKSNFQNNEKFIRMSLNIQNQLQQHRNLLGISKTPDWIQYFNIGTIMTLQPLKIVYKPNLDTFYLLSSNKILELILFTSVAYFTVATQIRFNELQAQKKSLNQSQKFLHMNENEKILRCKILHLRGIELVSRFMPNSKTYISHLVCSFNKNYKFYMDKIDEESSYLSSYLVKCDESPQKVKKSKRKPKSEKIDGRKRKSRASSVNQGNSISRYSKTKTKIMEISIEELKYSLPMRKKNKKASS